jgi:hypothetical protein
MNIYGRGDDSPEHVGHVENHGGDPRPLGQRVYDPSWANFKRFCPQILRLMGDTNPNL